MPATPARIGFISQEFRTAVATTPEAQARYGTLARKSDEPVETCFDDPEDAEIIAEARQDLLSPERRRFAVNVAGVTEILALDYTGAAPVVQYVDTERDADRKAIVSELSIDLGRERAAVTVWG